MLLKVVLRQRALIRSFTVCTFTFCTWPNRRPLPNKDPRDEQKITNKRPCRLSALFLPMEAFIQNSLFTQECLFKQTYSYFKLNLIYSLLSIDAFTSFWTEKSNSKCEYLLFFLTLIRLGFLRVVFPGWGSI